MSDQDQHKLKDQYMLRLPDGMRDRIKAVAASNNRSMNAEIVATLEEKYPAPKIEINLEKVEIALEKVKEGIRNLQMKLGVSPASLETVLNETLENQLRELLEDFLSRPD